MTKILLADDSIAVRKVIELTFRDEGFEIFTAEDGDAAMKKFVEVEPDLVMADVNMPGIGGYKICEIIKDDETTREIPVILLVGSFEAFDVAEASRVGANYYFTKPFQSIREVVDKVRDLLSTANGISAYSPETQDIEGLYADSFADLSPDNVPTADEIDDLPIFTSVPPQQPSYDISQDSFSPIFSSLENDETENQEPETVIEQLQEQVQESVQEHEEVQVPELHSEPSFLISDSPESEVRSEEIVKDTQAQTFNDDRIIETDDSKVQVFTVSDPIPEKSTANISEKEVEADSRPPIVNLNSVYDDDVTFDDHAIEEFRPNTFDVPAEVSTSTSAEENLSAPLIDPFESVAAEPQITNPEVSGSLSHVIEAVDGPAKTELVDTAIEPVPSAANIQPMTTVSILLSDEQIDTIVERIVAKMSDNAVREIALEAVPKVAEKLIREALAGERRD